MRCDRTQAWILTAAAGVGLGGLAVATAGTAAADGAAPTEASSGAAPALATSLLALSCLPALSATGHGKLQGPAANWAKLNWNQAKPAGYNNFGGGKGEDVTCRHDGRPPLLRQWTCVATAQPCKEVTGPPPPPPPPPPGPLCHAPFSLEGPPALLQPGAETVAVHEWQKTVTSNHGATYGAWGYAQGKSFNCRHNGLGPIQRRWRCVATASPCRKP